MPKKHPDRGLKKAERTTVVCDPELGQRLVEWAWRHEQSVPDAVRSLLRTALGLNESLIPYVEAAYDSTRKDSLQVRRTRR